jgi:DNA-binding response OmpR family regulator
MASRRWQRLSNVLLLTGAPDPPADILPSLSLLPHVVWVAPPTVSATRATPRADLVLIDARRDLVQVRPLLRLLRESSLEAAPILVIVADGGWAGVSADWGADDIILCTAGPGEVDARLRIALAGATPAATSESRSGDLAIDEVTYSARLNGRALDLTFKEFELLKFLAQSPGRVFTRSQLLQEVWGYDYFGGTRTVDVHVRRLRAKLGTEHEALIGTVRNVGYRFVPLKGEPDSQIAGTQTAGTQTAETGPDEAGPDGQPGALSPPRDGDGAGSEDNAGSEDGEAQRPASAGNSRPEPVQQREAGRARAQW